MANKKNTGVDEDAVTPVTEYTKPDDSAPNPPVTLAQHVNAIINEADVTTVECKRNSRASIVAGDRNLLIDGPATVIVVRGS